MLLLLLLLLQVVANLGMGLERSELQQHVDIDNIVVHANLGENCPHC